METKNNFNVAWCPRCDQGWVQIVKDPSKGELILLCRECDTIWDKPEDIYFGVPSDFEFGAYAVNPTDDEVKSKGWDTDIINL